MKEDKINKKEGIQIHPLNKTQACLSTILRTPYNFGFIISNPN
jgi:hypothetical protein